MKLNNAPDATRRKNLTSVHCGTATRTSRVGLGLLTIPFFACDELSKTSMLRATKCFSIDRLHAMRADF
jgi:hypothetical protein